MKAALKKRIISEIDKIPENKVVSLLNYIQFLRYEDDIKIPNKVTEQTFKDTDRGINLTSHSSMKDYFRKMKS